MRSIFLAIALFFSLSVAGQVLNLEEIEYSVENIESGKYKEKLTSSGFQLNETKKDGKSGIFEKWSRQDKALYVTIQHNASFKFTKMLISSSEPLRKPGIRNIIDEVSRSYSKKTIDDQFYYLSEVKPEITIHVVDLKEENTAVEGIIFFRKY